ncbi:response regulator [Sulfurimonas sp. SAG-AH-194-I05]|nr:response regulator [Sulfurimonas sp. SAG-AH-194-I05]MDF1875679.1 response regulator [Sulfurimonas sp. SAG-AH-194-I05]
MNKFIVIHNNNINTNFFEPIGNRKIFDSNNDIDGYISTEIIPDIKKRDLEIIFIKDNLSTNYMELIGLRVAYHIRLSQELEDKRFLPIVILSDLDSHILNKLDPIAKILFTKNVYIIKNTEDEIEKIRKKKFQKLTSLEYQEKFLDLIGIEPPKDYLSHHGIANEWSIYKWASTLNVKSDAIDINNNKISSLLYFKYLAQLHSIVNNEEQGKQELQEKGNILYIDDEWDKGWSDILTKLTDNSNIDFNTFKYDYKDINKFKLIRDIEKEIKNINPDVVILDLRLTKTDHSDIEINQLTGIKLINIIYEINPGIQVIMLTATTRSTILEKLYEHGILGYIKKEHPDDTSISTVENINKLIGLVNKGCERRYLKEIWTAHKRIKFRLLEDPFSQYITDGKEYETNLVKLIKESEYIFDILNSTKENKFNYALISLATSLDALQSIFISDYFDRNTRTKDYYYLGSLITEIGINSLPMQIAFIIRKSGHNTSLEYKKELKELNNSRNMYIHSNSEYKLVNADDILKWFNLLDNVIKKIQNPKINKVRPQKQLGSINGLESLIEKMK